MNYYLKYRPQSVGDLDLTEVRERLGKILSGKNWPHAWLLAGPKGTGKTSSARIIAKAMNCTAKRGGFEPCNHCSACRAITAGTAVDVWEIDAASNRSIDDIRDLRDKIKLAPTSLKYKVYIIDEAHMLTREAFNALLKTLEEPPAYAVLILATTEPDKLPETIVSRCVEVRFTKASDQELMRSLKRVAAGEKLAIKAGVLERVTRAAAGSFRDAVKLLEHPPKTKAFQLEAWLELVRQRRAKEALAWLERAWADGQDPGRLLLAAIERLRQVLLFRLGAGGKDLSGWTDLAALRSLLKLWLAAEAETKTAAIESLPLELAVAEWCQSGAPPAAAPPPKIKEPAGPDADWWPKVLAAVKPLNHSLEALLKAAEPAGFEADLLTIRVFYQFHKDRLEEERYRRLIEQAAAGVLNRPVKIRFYLGRKPAGRHQDLIKTAEAVFGIEVKD
jgi:DNA polymerase-3 subunit gamma/tau